MMEGRFHSRSSRRSLLASAHSISVQLIKSTVFYHPQGSRFHRNLPLSRPIAGNLAAPRHTLPIKNLCRQLSEPGIQIQFAEQNPIKTSPRSAV